MFISKLWRGDFSLPISYWLFGVLGNAVLSIPIGFTAWLNPILAWTLAAVTIIYGILVNVGIWRSSTKYQGNKIWAVLAKIAVVLGAASLLLSVATLTSVIDFKKKSLLASECLLNEVLQASTGMETQVWIAASAPCKTSSNKNLLDALGFSENYVNQVVKQNGDKLPYEAILLNEVIKAKKFYPVDRYKSLADCRLTELKRIKNSSSIVSSLVDDYCIQYVVSNLAMKDGFDMTGSMNAGYGYIHILNYLEQKYPSK